MSRVKKVLASAMIVIMLVVMVVPATVSAKATRYCSICGKAMSYQGVLPVSEMVAMIEVSYETRYGPVGPYIGQYTVKVVRHYAYARDVYYCSKCNKKEYVRFKYLDYITETRV
ncbi:MAG: hypothetical protein J6T40_09825 [Clostridiales bacterium]|nr:hypothetical protein [Clostridiales bacterium]